MADLSVALKCETNEEPRDWRVRLAKCIDKSQRCMDIAASARRDPNMQR